MATGPEHYQLAEAALEVAGSAEPGSNQESYSVAAAMVHATLAHAAATAMGVDMTRANYAGWAAVASAGGPEPAP